MMKNEVMLQHCNINTEIRSETSTLVLLKYFANNNNKSILFFRLSILNYITKTYNNFLFFLNIHTYKCYSFYFAGVLYSAIHVMEAIGRIGGATLFNNIYHQTLSIYHGLVFFIMAGFVFIAFILMT